MRLMFLSLLFLAQAMVFVDLARAATERPATVPGPDMQRCSAPIIAIVAKLPGLNAPDFESTVISAACKPSPDDKRVTITAIAYESEIEVWKNFLVALVDENGQKVVAVFKGEIQEDAAMRVVPNSFSLDTAPYQLTHDVRAFGVDLTGGYQANCGSGGAGADRTLYVREGKRLRPVMTTTLSYWSFLTGGNTRCMSAPDEFAEPVETVIETIDVAIGLGRGVTKGYRDLVVTATRSRDDGKPSANKTLRHTLHYDGRSYPSKAMNDRLLRWSR